MAQNIIPASEMTANDRELISRAWRTTPAQWDEISRLEEHADSDQAKEQLRGIMVHKHHLDEHFAGME